MDIYIKLYPFATEETYSILPVLKRFKRLKIVDHLTLKEFVEDFAPKAVIMEYPSTPLYEVIHLDTEIFLLDSDIGPFEKTAFEELEKRAYCYNDVDNMIEGIKLFNNFELDKKRDKTFYNHYVCSNDSQEKIIEFIKSTIENQ